MRKPRAKATKIRSSFLKLVPTFASWEPTCRTPFTPNGMKSTRLRASPLSHSSDSTPCRDCVTGAWRPEVNEHSQNWLCHATTRARRPRWAQRAAPLPREAAGLLACGVVSFLIGGRRALSRWASRFEGFFYEAKDCAAVLGDGFGPGETAHLREIDAAKTQAGDEDIDAVAEGLVGDGGYSVGDGLRAVGFGPAVLHLGVSFGGGHLEGRVGHGKGDELLPVFGGGGGAGGRRGVVCGGGGGGEGGRPRG